MKTRLKSWVYEINNDKVKAYLTTRFGEYKIVAVHPDTFEVIVVTKTGVRLTFRCTPETEIEVDYISFLKSTAEDFLGYEVSGMTVYEALKEAEKQGAIIAWNYVSKHIDLNYVFP